VYKIKQFHFKKMTVITGFERELCLEIGFAICGLIMKNWEFAICGLAHLRNLRMIVQVKIYRGFAVGWRGRGGE
jgi:hypothetical protein